MNNVEHVLEDNYILIAVFFYQFLKLDFTFEISIDAVSNLMQNLYLCSTGLLCLWLYAAGFSYPHHCNCLCNNCGDLLSA